MEPVNGSFGRVYRYPDPRHSPGQLAHKICRKYKGENYPLEKCTNNFVCSSFVLVYFLASAKDLCM